MKFVLNTKDDSLKSCIKHIADFDAPSQEQTDKFFNNFVNCLQKQWDVSEVEIEFDALLNRANNTIFGNLQNKPRTYVLNDKLYFAKDILSSQEHLVEDLLAVAYGVGMYAERTKIVAAPKKSVVNRTTIPLDKMPDPAFYRSVVEYMAGEVDTEKLYSYSLAKYVADSMQSEQRKKANMFVEKLIDDAAKATKNKKVKG